MTDTIYSMSFTTGTLLYRESILMAELYCELSDWKAVRKIVLAENQLQMRTQNAAVRIQREVSSRLKLLTQPQIDFLTTCSRPEQNHLLWLALCKRYHFIRDFAVEVIREKYLRLDLSLDYNDYDIFFHNKAEWHPEVERVALSTQSKQRQVVFKSLREAELLTDSNQILPVLLSQYLVKLITDDDPNYLAIFPTR